LKEKIFKECLFNKNLIHLIEEKEDLVKRGGRKVFYAVF
jgi:hypothetical protein